MCALRACGRLPIRLRGGRISALLSKRDVDVELASQVMMEGLQSMPELNGQTGKGLGLDAFITFQIRRSFIFRFFFPLK